MKLSRNSLIKNIWIHSLQCQTPSSVSSKSIERIRINSARPYITSKNNTKFRFFPAQPQQYYQQSWFFPRLFGDLPPPIDGTPTPASTSSVCWQCGKELSGRKLPTNCPHCQRLQPIAAGIDYFDYLGITPKFELNEADLKMRFRQRQATVHPDKYSQNAPEEQRYSEQHSTFLNNAYRTLRDPFSRADYLLELLEKQQTAPPINEAEQTDGPELAEQIMEMNESIEQMREMGQIERKKAEIEAELQRLLAQLSEQLARRAVQEGRRTMRRIGYFRRSKRLLEKKMEEIDG